MDSELQKLGFHTYVDFWDYDELDKLQDKRSYQWLKLFKKIHDAREKGDEKAEEKAIAAMRKHEAIDQLLKAKANETGYFWP